MSETVSNAQVEDVLASIRKLVSHDKRPAREVAKEPVTTFVRDAAPEGESKFVLAPAFRVAEEANEADQTAVSDEDQADAAFQVEQNETASEPSVSLMSEGLDLAPDEQLDLGTDMDVEDAPAEFDDLERVVLNIKDPHDAADNDVVAPEALEQSIEEAPFERAPEDEPLELSFEHRSWGELSANRLDDLSVTPESAVETDETLQSWYGQHNAEEDDEAAASWDFISASDTSRSVDAGTTSEEGAEPADLTSIDEAAETPEPAETGELEDASLALQAKISALEAVISKQDNQLQDALASAPIEIDELDPASEIEVAVEDDDDGAEVVQLSNSADLMDRLRGEDTAADTESIDDSVTAFVDPSLEVVPTGGDVELNVDDPQLSEEHLQAEPQQIEDAEVPLDISETSEALDPAAPSDEVAEKVSDYDEDGALDLEETAAEIETVATQETVEAVSIGAATQILAQDADVLDEEMLRDLVSDIVRQELQGALGERITRNVRKLVRREIHRAMATQELD